MRLHLRRNCRAHALWVVERLRGLSAAEIDRLAHDEKPIVRTHLLKALAERKDWAETSAINIRELILQRIAEDKNAHVVHAGVDALARHADRLNVEPLLDVWKKTPTKDTHLIHAIRIALRNNLRDLNATESIAQSLGDSEEVVARLTDVCLGIPQSDAAGFLVKCIGAGKYEKSREAELFHHAARYADADGVARLIEQAPNIVGDDSPRQSQVLRALFHASQERGETPTATLGTWGSKVVDKLLRSRSSNNCRQGIELARDLRLASAKEAIAALTPKDSRHADCRTAALDALAQIDPARATAILSSIVPDASDSIDVRQPAAELLGKLKDPASTPILSQLLTIATGNLAVYAARGLSWSDAGADALLTLMESGKAPAELLHDGVVGHELKFRQAPRKDERIEGLKASIPTPDEAVRSILTSRNDAWKNQPGEAGRGEATFNKNCGICHQIANKGAKIGPQLDGVGIRGIDRLLEDTLDPDRNVDQAFRKRTFVKTDGSVLSGLVLRKEGAVVVLADAQGKEVRLASSDIDEEQESKLSPMPSDVARGLPEPEFLDLMAYLLSQRTAPAQP
jgi:putative heme-binding domain-containing protein